MQFCLGYYRINIDYGNLIRLDLLPDTATIGLNDILTLCYIVHAKTRLQFRLASVHWYFIISEGFLFTATIGLLWIGVPW